MAQEPQAPAAVVKKTYSPAYLACIEAIKRGDLTAFLTQYKKIRDVTERARLFSPVVIQYVFNRGHVELEDYFWSQMDENTKNQMFRWVCGNGHLKEVERFYDTCPNVNAKDENGNTALGFSLSRNHFSVVQFLCSNPKTSLVDLNSAGSNALFLACALGNPDAAMFFQNKFNAQERIDAFNWIFYYGHVKVVQSFYSERPEVSVFRGAKCEEVQKRANFYFFAAISFLLHNKSDEGIQCLKIAYEEDPEAFRNQLTCFISTQDKQKCYFLGKYAYDRFLRSVLITLQDANVTPEYGKSLYLESAQQLLRINIKYKKEQEINLHRSLLLLSQWRDTESSQIKDELATCLSRLLDLKKSTTFDSLIKKYSQKIIDIVKDVMSDFSSIGFTSQHLAGLRNICELAAHYLVEEQETKNKRGGGKENNQLSEGNSSTKKQAAKKRVISEPETPEQAKPEPATQKRVTSKRATKKQVAASFWPASDNHSSDGEEGSARILLGLKSNAQQPERIQRGASVQAIVARDEQARRKSSSSPDDVAAAELLMQLKSPK